MKIPDLAFTATMSSNSDHQNHRSLSHQTTAPAVVVPPVCSHLAEFKAGRGAVVYGEVLKCIRVRPLGGSCVRREPNDVPRCCACGHARPRLYACVSCIGVHCNLHALDHGHVIAVDVDRAELFCCACGDQVYDRDFDSAIVVLQTTASILGGRDSDSEPPPENLRKRRRVEYRPWTPDSRERELLGTNSRPLPGTDDQSSANSNFPWGLKGLNNLGNTCFMNSVLQALLHTPPLRNYFLSDKHNRFVCQQKSGVHHKNDGSKKNSQRLCLTCDMDALFSAVFSGDRRPYSPARFLYSWWQHAGNLANYEQQDAHEFFISMLDGIHEKADEDKRRPHSQDSGDCCIAHKVFSGILRSDVMCTACGFTSTTYDPCIDISLDLLSNQEGSAKTTSAKTHHSCIGGAESASLGQSSVIPSLMGCLERFTRPERLGSDQKFFCQQCQMRQESLKQMSIRKLPLVSCFHIKRFEHSPIRKMSRKVDRYMQFPISLDMSPYLSSSILRSRFGNRIFAFDGDGTESDSSNESSSEFELFAVVTHSGKIDSGHYVTYLRLSNEWYKCDDAWVTQVNENIVRAAQGYMMFYVQKMLYYKASEKVASL